MNLPTTFRTALFILFGVATAGCTTQFFGDAHVPNGRTGCEARCNEQGMYLAGMVMMGEYSDGCVCSVEPPSGAASPAVAGAAPAAIGVVMQMREEEASEATLLAAP